MREEAREIRGRGGGPGQLFNFTATYFLKPLLFFLTFVSFLLLSFVFSFSIPFFGSFLFLSSLSFVSFTRTAWHGHGHGAGPGAVWTTHNGDPANLSPNDASWYQPMYCTVVGDESPPKSGNTNHLLKLSRYVLPV